MAILLSSSPTESATLEPINLAAAAALAADGVALTEDARCIARVGDKDIWLAIAEDGEGNLLGVMSEEAVGS